MATYFILDLPLELRLELFSFLDSVSLCRCRQVCQDFKSLIDTAATLQYKIELYTTGTESSVLDHRDIAFRLEKLKAFKHGWEELNFPTHTKLPMNRGGVWELYGSVLAQNTKSDMFHFHRLPSSIRGIEQKSWVMKRTGYPVRDFGMDPSQDLLVLIGKPKWSRDCGETTHTLQLLSLETAPGEPHPLASSKDKCLRYVQDFRDNHFSYTIQISGDHLGLLINTDQTGENQLLVWNWKKGELLMSLLGDQIRSFSFLSDEHILLFTLLFPEDRVKPNLAVVNFKGEGNSTLLVTEAKTAVSFRYPPLSPAALLVAFDIRSDPAPTWEPRFDVNVPFHLAKNNRVYVSTLWIHVGGRAECIMLFVPWDTFMGSLRSAGDPVEGEVVRDWDDWGPKGTRLLISPHGHSLVWVCYVYGTRYVALEPSRSSDDSRCRVYDFNQIGLRKAIRDAGTGDQVITEEGVGESTKTSLHTIYQIAPTVIPAGEIFEEEVRTSLPYRWKSMPLDLERRPGCSIMCTEDNIILIDTRNHEYLFYSF